MRNACAVFCCHLCPVRLYHIFSTRSHKWRNFRRKIYWTWTVCFIFSTILSKIFPIRRKTQLDIVVIVKTSYCNVQVIPVIFYLNLNFLDRFSKNTQVSNLIKIRKVGTEFSHADRRTDMTKLSFFFRSFANAPKKVQMGAKYIRFLWFLH
jgi:hypothetical protein